MGKTNYIIALAALVIVVGGIWYILAQDTGENNANTGTNNQPAGNSGQGQGEDSNPMSFFVTSANPGKGADLGGLAGADSYCQSLASSAGAGNKTWRAYLSTQENGELNAINARDRIGTGPWQNTKGIVIANSVEELHSDNNNLNKQTALTEKGETVNGRGDTPNLHDILTGSGMDGRAIATSTDVTCGNWTKSGAGSAMLGHHDRVGLRDDAPSKSWNSSHASRGCDIESLKATGGGGLFYCFAQ